MCCLNNQKGIALVVTLLAVALLTALVVEFAYGVYTGTNDLYNWRDAQRLSLMAKSGVNVSAKLLSNEKIREQYNEPVEMPVENPFEDFKGTVTIRVENEDAKFNMNAIVPANQNIGDEKNDPSIPLACFIRLLKALKLDVTIADRVVDWIDTNSEARLGDSETGAKNAAFNSVDELLLIHGISRKDYDTLLPYVTVSKERALLIVNVNGAESPVLQSLSPAINEEVAKTIINARKSKSFEKIGDFNSKAGISLTRERIRTDGTIFSIRSTAASGGVKRIIETVLDTEHTTIQYWKEY
jgi:general secretion pathway protein K